MSASEPQGPGLFAALRRIGDSLLALGQSRLHLFALELQGERLRVLDSLAWLGVALVLGGVGLLLATITVALYLWETARFTGLLVMTGLYLGASAVLFWRLRERMSKGPTPFADTLAEFKKDRECFFKPE